MKIQILLHYIFTGLVLLTSCSKEAENSNDINHESVRIPQSLVTCFQQAQYIEDIFKADTLKLKTSKVVLPAMSMVRSIHFSKNGNIYVGSQSDYVVQFDSTGQMIQKIGRSGQGPGEYTWANYVNTNSRGELVVGDVGQHKITINDNNGMFLNTFTVLHNMFDGLFISAQDEIIIHDNFNGRRLQQETIYVYSRDGKLQIKFGSVSKPGAKLKNVPFSPGGGPFLTIYGEHIFEADYPDYKIRKYNLHGRLLKEFGSKPKNWRSLLKSGYEKLPQPQMLTPAIQKKLRDFIKEFRKYPMVHWITSFRPGILTMMTKPSASPSGGEDTYFVFYDVDGNLLNKGLTFRNSFLENKYLETEIIGTTPEGFCILQSNSENNDVLLIRMRIKKVW